MLLFLQKKAFNLIFNAFCIVSCMHIEGAVSNRPSNDTNNQYATAIRETRDFVQDMRHQLNNQEETIQTFDEKIKNLDTIIESLRDQLNGVQQNHQDQLKNHINSVNDKITALETLSQNLVSDMKQFKTHTQETNTAFLSYNKKITHLENIIEVQNKNIEYLQTAIYSITEALNHKETSNLKKLTNSSQTSYEQTVPNTSTKTYIVKNGDSLEKIAKANNTDVQSIREINGLTNDKIIVGKKLKLP